MILIGEKNIESLTLEEVLKYQHDEEICPDQIGLDITENVKCDPTDEVCEKCWRKSLSESNIKLKQSDVNLTLFEGKSLNILGALKDAETNYKKLGEERDILKNKIKDLMIESGITKFENDNFAITYVAPGKSKKFNSTNFKKDHKDLYDKYSSYTETKENIRFKIK